MEYMDQDAGAKYASNGKNQCDIDIQAVVVVPGRMEAKRFSDYEIKVTRCITGSASCLLYGILFQRNFITEQNINQV